MSTFSWTSQSRIGASWRSNPPEAQKPHLHLSDATEIRSGVDMMNARRLAVVEDDGVFAQILLQNLSAAGYEPSWYDCPESAIGEIDALKHANLIILDWRLPSMTGVELLQKLRQLGCATP